MIAARYWRLRVESAGSDVVSCARLRLYSDDFGADVVGGFITSNSVYGGNPLYDPARCRDDDPGSIYASDRNPAPGDPIDLTIDFGPGEERTIIAFSYQARADGYWTQSMLSGGLEYSNDGIAYIRLIQADATPWAGGEVKTWMVPPPDPVGSVRAAIPFTGDNIALTVASGTSSIRARLFGAGGAGGRYTTERFGGAGGYTEVEWPVAEGDEIIIQVPQGGQQSEPGGYSSGGWPDGGYGAPGDTTPAGGGGSARLWVNGELIAVAGGGGGSAGYAYWGAAGGGIIGGIENPYSASQTAPGRDGDAVRAGRSIAEAGMNGVTGGAGGAAGGDDGAGGGGGYFGGGGGGGDGAGGGGGSGYVRPGAIHAYTETAARGTHASAGSWSPDFLEGIGYGPESNSLEPGGNGLAVLYTETALTGDAPEVPDPTALVARVEAQVVYTTNDGPVKLANLRTELGYTNAVRPARLSSVRVDLGYDALYRHAKVSNLWLEVMRSLRVPPPRHRGLILPNVF